MTSDSRSSRNELSYYPEIQGYISSQIKSNLLASGVNNVEVYWKIVGRGNMATKLQELIREHPDKCSCLRRFANNMPPLQPDVIGIVTNGERFQLIILEVKLVQNVGLAEWSQLLGYCVVSDARYGLLINVDGGTSERLRDILLSNKDVSYIARKKGNGDLIECFAGFMRWNSITHNFEYTTLGQVGSLSAISDLLVHDLTI